MSSLFSNVGVAPVVLVFLSTFAFVYSAVLFVAAGLRGRQEKALARRSDLVMPRTAPNPDDARFAKQDLPKQLLRLPGQGFPEREQREIIRCLAPLGVPAARAILLFSLGRLAAAVSLGIVATVVMRYIPALAGSLLIAPLASACAVAAGFLLPPRLIRMSLRRRAQAVVGGLPEALDLLVVCVDAGLSLEDSLARVVNELGRWQPELADELALTSAELQILPSRDEALENMARRVDLPSMRSVVATLIQTLRYGTPLAQALRVIGSELRNDTLIKLEERANALPALLTVPMMLFIMPTIFLIIGGPAALRALDAFGH